MTSNRYTLLSRMPGRHQWHMVAARIMPLLECARLGHDRVVIVVDPPIGVSADDPVHERYRLTEGWDRHGS